MIFHSSSPAQTESIAADFAAQLSAGQVIALHGDLGAGKTQFVRGLAKALGANPRAVHSPTFVLLNIYNGGRLTLFHLDAYRISTPEDFEQIGFPELLEQNGIVAVEWAAKVAALIPNSAYTVKIQVTAESQRRIEILPGSPHPEIRNPQSAIRNSSP